MMIGMTDDSTLAIREVNLAIPDLLAAALENSRSVNGSEQFNASMTNAREVSTRMHASLPVDAVTFAVARYAMQMVDQLSVEAGRQAEDVIAHFAETYRRTAADET